MQLSKETLAIIKNFASINQNLLIKPGNILYTLSPTKWIYAEAKIAETFDDTFGIYDLNELLSIHSIMNNPELTFDGNTLYISEDKLKVRFQSAEHSVLIYPKNPNHFPADAEVTFDLSSGMLQQIIRSASILKAPFVSIVGDGTKFGITVTDKNNVNANQLHIEIGQTEHVFSVNLKAELFKMMPDDYEFALSSTRKACKISGNDRLYMLAWETDSAFQK
jgi:hypothetical protein